MSNLLHKELKLAVSPLSWFFLAAAVMTARKVMTHEEQIAALNRRIVELESEIKQLKAA